MTNPDDPAFPQTVPVMIETRTGSARKIGDQFISGLTKREYFAAMAMQGLCANVQFQIGCAAVAERKGTHVAAELALAAKDMADAMIAELSK